MAVLALALTFIWIVLVAGARGFTHARQTGEPGVALRDRRGSPQWWSRLISTVGFLLALAAPLAEIAGVPAFASIDDPVGRVAGVGLVLAGIVGSLAAQRALGASWRADVDPDVRTDMVTAGPYRLVRNPVFTATATTSLGLALMVPNVLAAVMLAAFVTALHVQVRLVEEPYLLRVHGAAYRAYAARTGRFLPWIGRLRPD